ncbi:MAG: phosphotriesterase-related protein [Chloroflexi bacterium]|nr:phosphotriesterase-related protein [Chloroflexota bacterium]
MPRGEHRGLIQTVLGPVAPSELGPTTTHEHLHVDISFLFRPARYSPSRELEDAPLTLEHLGWIRRNYYSNHSNLHLMDPDTAIREARMYRDVGGGAIVDATTARIGRDPDVLARISRESGVHVIMGAGFYVDARHPEDMDERNVEDLALEIVADVTEGVDGTGIRAGIIGEVGCGWPLTPNERKSLAASAIAQQETGAAILIHPGRNQGAPAEILELLADGGADISRVIMGHLDRTVFDFDVLRGIAGWGCYLEWDLFGNEGSYYPQADIDMPSDAQRLDLIRRIADEGYGDRVVMGHDIFTKHRLVTYGGHGYGHILENIVPTMRRKGFSDDEIRAITEDNPASVLALA